VTALAVALATLGVVAVEASSQTSPQPAAAAAVPTDPLAPLSDRRIVTGWIPYWDVAEGVAAVVDHPSVFAEVSPFWYRATESGQVKPMTGNNLPEADLTAAIAELHAAGVAAYPSVKDDGFDGHEMALLLTDEQKRQALADDVAAMVARTGADGADIDFESMNFGGSGRERTAVKRLYPVFLGELQQRLHAQDAMLTVALPARRSATDNSWEVIDYRAISSVVDRARLMTYDFSIDRPGPIGPYDWTKDVAEYARKEFRGVPLSIGVAAYGRNWYQKTLRGSCPPAAKRSTAPTTTQAFGLADQFGADPRWSQSPREYHYDYRRPYPEYGRCVVMRRVWFGEARSAEERMLLAKRLRVQGIAVFSFGFEDPRLLNRARQVARTITPDPAKLTVGAPVGATSGELITVFGRASVKGVPIASKTVRLQKRAPKRRWVDVTTGVTDPTGRVSWRVTASRTVDWRITLPGGWDWAVTASGPARTSVS
jgi:spore germination protein YaaH